MSLVLTLTLCFILLTIFFRIFDKRHFLLSSLLVTEILSIIISISLSVNYLVALTGIEDGIAINNWISRILIGDDSWSNELFHHYFDYSVTACLVIAFLIIIVIPLERKLFGNYKT